MLEWDTAWREDDHRTTLHDIRRNVFEQINYKNISGKGQTAITRIRIGHIRLTYSYRLEKCVTMICDTCSQEITMDDVIFHCTKFSDHRKQYKTSANTREELKNPKKLQKILLFLKDIQLLPTL